MAERLLWQGVARDPVAVTSAVHEAVVKAGAWIERSEAYSNLSLSLVLGMSSDDAPGVARALAAVVGFEPNDKTRASLDSVAASGATTAVAEPRDACAIPPGAASAAAGGRAGGAGGTIGPRALAVGRPWAPSGGPSDVFATLLLLYPRGDGSVARERPPG